MKRGLKITFLPFVFFAVGVESRFSRNVVLVESSADIVLVFGGKVRFFPVEAVVFSAAEMGYQLAFQRLEKRCRQLSAFGHWLLKQRE